MKPPWPEVPIGEFLRPVRELVQINDSREYSQITVAMHGRGVRLRQTVFGKAIKTKNQFKAKSGRFIYSRIDARNGAMGIIPDELDGSVISGDFPTFDFELGKVVPRFFWYMTKTASFEEKCLTPSRGVTNRKRLKEAKLLSFRVHLPPLPEQRRILEKIDQIAARVEEAKRLRSSVDEMMKTLYRGMVRDILVNARKQHPVCHLSELFEYRQELIRPGTKRKTPIRFVGLQHLEPHSGRRIGEDAIDPQTLRGRKFTFEVGDILYGYLRPYLNKVWLADLDGACSVDQYVLIPRHELVLPKYLAAIIRSPLVLDVAEQKTNPLTLPRLSSRDFGAIEVPLPEGKTDQQALLEQIETIRQSMVTLVELQKAQTEETEALMPALLDQAFRGEL